MVSRSAILLAAMSLASMPLRASAADEPAKLPFVASVARVRIEVSKRDLVVVHDVNLARGDFRGEDVEVFVAFGAPGTPRGVDARLITIARGALEASPRERGASVGWQYVKRRPPAAMPLIGRETMAGVSIKLPGELVERSLAAGNMVALRIAARHELPTSVAPAERDLIVRLGDGPTGPLVLGRIEVAASEEGALDRAEARRCTEKTAGPLLTLRQLTATTARKQPGLAPVISPRSAGEDLCVRLIGQ